MAKKKCGIHSAPLKPGQKTVFAEGRPVGRKGDRTCTQVAKGSSNVFAVGKPICRKGDFEIPHCSPMVRMGAFKSVFCNGKPISGAGHLNTPHLKPAAKAPATVPGSEGIFTTGGMASTTDVSP